MLIPSGTESNNPYRSPESGTEEPQEFDANKGPAWESLGPSPRTFLLTAREFYFRLFRFFRKLGLTGGVGKPLLYLFIAHTIGECVYMAQFLAVMTGTVPWQLGPPPFPREWLLTITSVAFASSLVWALLLPFLAGAIYQGMLLLMGTRNKGFKATLRVVTYSHAHGFLLYVIPCFGYFVGVIAALVFTIIGLCITHEINPWRSTAVVLVPFLIGLLAALGITSLA